MGFSSGLVACVSVVVALVVAVAVAVASVLAASGWAGFLAGGFFWPPRLEPPPRLDPPSEDMMCQ